MPSLRTSLSFSLLLTCASLFAITSCQSGGDTSSVHSGPDSGLGAAAQRQIARGAEVYTASCARCHGASGEGTAKGPPVVGPDALPLRPRDWQKRSGEFRTALDVAVFATQAMPPSADEREAIAAEDYWATLAFALSANGVTLRQPVSAATAKMIVLHP